ncbi:MAG TPA: efflux RND transporter periplasmic adaptor subunit [Pyrinomonadaceae bacterium]|nr:efflux RND transporter periplasmic adaptor subunit [Pyrinomonadaceae bacterium]
MPLLFTMPRVPNTLFVLVFIVCLLSACSAGSKPRQLSAVPTPAAPVVVNVFDAQPSANSSSGDLLIPAAISVEQTAVVLAEREGRIINLPGQEADHVTKGGILAQFNEDDQRSQLRQAEIEVHRLSVEEQQYDALVKLNRSELDRELLLAKQGLSSSADVERAKYKHDQSLHEYKKTTLATEGARARVEAAKLELQKSTVRAPITGIITRRYVALGTNVARYDKLFEISKLAPLQVKFQLPQTEKIVPTRGQIVRLSAVNNSQPIATARIRRIDPIADATINTFGYLADVISGPGLMPGVAVNVHLPRPPNVGSFWIPRAAFQPTADLQNGSSMTLFVVEGDKASSRVVLVSGFEGDQVEVVSGLVKDDRIVLAPPAGLKDGDVVQLNRG